MKRLVSIVVLVLTVLGLSACGGGAKSSKVKKIKVGHGASESYHMHRAWVKFKEVLEKNGNFAVEIYPSSQLGNDAEMIESVKTGDLTVCVPPSSFLTDESPNMALIELPYVFPSRDAAISTLKNNWGQEQLKNLEDDGMHGFGYLENGLRHLTNSKKGVRSPESLKGLKLRTMQVPSHVYLWNDLGATAEGAPFAELYTNLSTKVFDGQENPIAHIHSQKFFEVQDYITLTGHVYTAYVPVMNIDFWNELSSEEQKQVNEAFEMTRKYQLDLINAEETAQLEEIKENSAYPTTVIELSKQEKQKFINAAQPTLQYYREKLGATEFDKFENAVQASL